MSIGYSVRIYRLNKAADVASVGVRLGRACLLEDIPAAEVARRLGVSRQTVYNWFCGKNQPHAAAQVAIEKYLAQLGPVA